ncbi:uncharacterized protein LOC124421411 isoform X2 [Lucilia cuprina]|uniref:uncharacterized protein LOC124421411 isoform X2 n=1 Tax=Lucilia cuprina TaxID=7375 RepID=UPI001F06398F|nr:uncharacterized protein LOC124421411 isoform X2 [Lucilia cuprina]
MSGNNTKEDKPIPKITSAHKKQRKLPPDILQLIYEKKRLRRILQRTGDPTRIPSLKSDIRNLNMIIRDAIAKYDDEKLNKLMSRVTIGQGLVLSRKISKKT